MKGQILSLMVIIFLFLAPQLTMAAVNFNQAPSSQDQATFDQILQPVMKIYNLVKYFASALAGIALLFAGTSYMTSGTDPKQRENSKSMAMYVIIGLVVIWAAPLLVSLIV